MDGKFDTHVTCESWKNKRREETKSGGGRFSKQNGAVGEDRQRGCRGAMLVQFIQRGGRGDSRAQGALQTNRREKEEEEVEEDQRGSEGVDRRGGGRDEADAQAMQDA